MAETFVVQYNLLPQLAAALHDAVADVVTRTAKEIAAEAAGNHPYQNQTGQAESAFYIVTQNESTYGQGFIGGDGKAGSEILPEVEKPPNDQTAYVSNASGHFAFLELGTSRMSALPSLIPAAELGQTFFTEWLADIENDMKKRASAP